MDDLNIGAMKARLVDRRAELLADDAATSADRAPVELDQQSVGRLSRMDAMQVREMARAHAGRRRAELARIDDALERLDAGDYGHCTACGEAIAPKRLAWDPAIATCVRCAGGGGET
jgi:RNA polymerase-binding transcription factor